MKEPGQEADYPSDERVLLDFSTRDKSRLRRTYIPLRSVIASLITQLCKETRGWDEISKKQLARDHPAHNDLPLGKTLKHIAVWRVGNALARSGELVAYVEGRQPGHPREIPRSFWLQQGCTVLNMDPLISGRVSASPFGADVRTDLPADVDGKEIKLEKWRVEVWLKKKVRKLRRQRTDLATLEAWYAKARLVGELPADPSKLRQRAREDLGIDVSRELIRRLSGRQSG